MKLKCVIPDMEKTFGTLEYGGEGGAVERRVNGRTKVVERHYNLFSDRQRADNIEVVLPGEVGAKQFDFEQEVKLENPRIVAQGKKIGDHGYTDYILVADDMTAKQV